MMTLELEVLLDEVNNRIMSVKRKYAIIRCHTQSKPNRFNERREGSDYGLFYKTAPLQTNCPKPRLEETPIQSNS